MVDKVLWVDRLKAFGIIVVVLGHIASPLGGFIFSWHMPLFFMVAGFFIKFDLNLKDFIFKDFQRLMLPYFIFVTLGVIAEIIKRILLHRDMIDYKQTLYGMIYYMDIESLSGHYGNILWFLPALFFARFILYLIKKITTILILQFIIVSILFMISFNINLPFAVDEAFNGLIWLYIGYIYYNHFQKYNSILLVLFNISLLFILYFYTIPVLNISTKYYENIFVTIIWASAIVFIFSYIFKNIRLFTKINNIISIWGSNTMILYVMHAYTNNIAHIVVRKIIFIHNLDDSPISLWYIKLIISLSLLTLVILLKLKFSKQGIFKYV